MQDPNIMADVLSSGGGGAAGPAPGAGGPPVPSAPGAPMPPEAAMQLLQQHGITPDNAPMIAQALMTVQQAMGGGAGGPPPGAGGPPPGAGGPPPGGMPPGM